MKLLPAYLRVAKLFVKRQEFSAWAEDTKIHPAAPSIPTMVLGCFDHYATETSSLLRRIDREHSEVSALAANLDVNTCRNLV